MATILQFPPPERYAHRRNLSATAHYRTQVRVAEYLWNPRRILMQLWLVVLTMALILLAVDLASAAATAPAGPNDDICDIRGVVHITASWTWLLWLAGAIALAVAAYALRLWWKSRQKERAKSAFELAIEALATVRALMSPEKGREFSFRVSQITRNYIEARFGARAAHRTTEEFFHDLVNHPTPGLAVHASLLEDFLKHCDLAKFARWTLSAQEMEKMHASALAFVNATNPQLDIAAAPSQTELRTPES